MLIALLLAFVVCIGVFLYQYNNDVATFIIVNETQVVENGSFSGMLMDSYGQGVANKTVTCHKPDGTVIEVMTDENGEFTISNAEYLPDAGEGNCYSGFAFEGDGKYLGCTYEGNVTVTAK